MRERALVVVEDDVNEVVEEWQRILSYKDHQNPEGKSAALEPISRDINMILSHSHSFSHSTTFYLLSALSRAFSWLPYALKLLANESRPKLQPG